MYKKNEIIQNLINHLNNIGDIESIKLIGEFIKNDHISIKQSYILLAPKEVGEIYESLEKDVIDLVNNYKLTYKEKDVCPHCNGDVNYSNHKQHLYMYCINAPEFTTSSTID